MRVLVCGGRHYDNVDYVFKVLDFYHNDRGPITRIIQGGQTGADSIARRWAYAWNISCTTYHADWGRLGPAAGPIRNQRMLDSEELDLVIAFPGYRGTADMVKRAKDKGIKVVEL